jgi:hypothetical protein
MKFSLSVSYSLDPGSSWSFMNGKYEQHKDTLLLNVDSIKMFIHKDKLYNFRQSKTPITLKVYDLGTALTIMDQN